jgi:transposase
MIIKPTDISMDTYIGIDLHKRVQTWALYTQEGETPTIINSFSVTPEHIRSALSKVRTLFPNTQLHVAIEPVCGWLWVVPQLRSEGCDVHIVNTRKTKLVSESTQKTDKKDAAILARLLRSNMLYEIAEVSEETRALRNLVRERVFVVKLRSEAKCRLESIVTRSGRHTIAHTLSSKKGKEELNAGEDEWGRTIALITDLDGHVATLDTAIKTHAKSSEAKLLMTIPGVGPVTAVSVLAEVGDFSRFRKPSQICAFAGLVPTERSSGGVQKLGGITHAGSKVLRFVLVEAAMRVREKHTKLYTFYDRIAQKRGKMRARVALSRKMLEIMWYMVQRNEPYHV